MLVNIGIPGGVGFKIGTKLANQALRSKKAGTYFTMTDEKGRILSDTATKLARLNKKGRVAKFSAGAITGGSLVISDGGNIGSASDTDAISIASGGNVTMTQDLTVTGNLTVNGSTSTISTTNTTIEDALIELGTGTTGTPSNDAGIVIERGNTGADAAFIWDESSDSFAVGTLSTDGAILFDKADGTSQPLPISSSEVAFNHADGTADNHAVNFDQIYPVGSIYMNASSNVNPGTLLGIGTWQALAPGRVLLGAGSNDGQTYTAGGTSGARTHTLTANQVPSHSHGLGSHIPVSYTHLTLPTNREV